MKRRLCLAAVAAAVAFAAAGCYRPVIREIQVRVPHMRSEEGARIALGTLGGFDTNMILKVEADFGSQTIRVRYNSERIAIRNIQHAIASAGFDADDIPGNAEARAKLPADCQ
jgi:copper chaperone CopZ